MSAAVPATERAKQNGFLRHREPVLVFKIVLTEDTLHDNMIFEKT